MHKVHVMQCDPKQIHQSGCCTPHGRQFMTKKEKKEMLEQYKEQLEKELEGVSEKIDEMEKK